MWNIVRFSAASLRGSRRFSAAIPGPCIVRKRGADILHDAWFNKDTGFPLTERDRLGLRGLLPPRVISFEQQYARFMESYRSLEKNTQGQPDNIVSLAKWRILNRLHDRNETLYYRVLIDNIEDFAPIIYTPTVGLVCQNYSGLFRRPRGMYFSAKDKGEMMSMIYNWPAQKVDMIVLTDGSRILGLGDLGVQGIGIPIGKLDMYVAAAGINPQKILPVMLDVGTNNQKLLEDRLYLGLRQPRLEGDEYLEIVDEFMEAVHARWPKAIVQFEDFQMKWAFETLQRYRKRFCMFNDDIQGTAGVALAGLLGTVRAQGQQLKDFINQKIVVVGAGRVSSLKRGRTLILQLHQFQQSGSARIVNLSSLSAVLKNIRRKSTRDTLRDIENLTRDRIDEILKEFLEDFRHGQLEAKGWPVYLSAYKVSKALNAYTRLLAKEFPSLLVNSIHPGFVKTDIRGNNGVLSAEEGAESAVHLALQPENGPSGLFFSGKEVSSF